MPGLSIGEIKYMITLNKKISCNFFFEILAWEKFQAILGKFRGNSDWDWGRISAPNRFQKTLEALAGARCAGRSARV